MNINQSIISMYSNNEVELLQKNLGIIQKHDTWNRYIKFKKRFFINEICKLLSGCRYR